MDTTTQQLTRQHVSDSRLLQNLYKSERAYVDHLSSAVASALAASSALSSWGTSEPADISSAAAEIADGLAHVANAQRTHVQAIEGYRAALKDVLDREQSIRNIVRDRDILVKRLIKADQKRAKSVGADPNKEAERYQKHLFAQRELAACEDALQAEENALIGVKRRTFKEALTMRMKTMGDAGAAMVDAAKDAIILLDSFDTNGQMPIPPPLPSRPDEDGQGWEYAEQPYDIDTPNAGAEQSFTHFNENASVTPSQSASQINYGGGAAYSRPARYAGGNFGEIGETSNGHEAGEQQEHLNPQAEPSEADSDQDYQEAFGGNNHVAHNNKNNFAQQASLPEPPAPTPPLKEDRPPSRMVGEYPQVSMPPVPSAPSLHTGGPDLGPIPTASRVYIRGQDSSSEDGDHPPVRSASRSGWTSHIGSGAGHRRHESADSGMGAGSASRPNNPTRSNSFFGRMGRLFKTDIKDKPTLTSSPSKVSVGQQPQQHERPVSRAETPSRSETPSRGIGRRISLLRGPSAPDSSDEEDTREFVRHINPRQPLWSAASVGKKASSDIGTKGQLASLPPSARITPGPMSSRQQDEKRDAESKQQQQRPVSMIETVATSQKPKKKKKKASSTRRASSAFETGSEVGTAPTRAAGYEQGVAPTSVVKGGDAASLSGPRPGLQRNSSVRSSATAGGSTIGGKKKKKSKGGVTAMNAFTTGETASKFSTANWVSRPDGGAPNANSGPIAEAVANAGVVPKSEAHSAAPAAATSSVPATPTRQGSVRNKAVASPLNVPSASKNPPLKPALKHTSAMNRSNSQTTDLSAGYQDLPQLAPPVKAPPPISSLPQDIMAASLPSAQTKASPLAKTQEAASRQQQTETTPQASSKKAKPPALLKLAPDDNFDGSGRLGVPGTSPLPSPAREKATAKPSQENVTSPKIEMPKSEPFKLDLGNLSNNSAKPATTLPRQSFDAEGMTPASDREFLTPTEQEAYHLFLNTPEEPGVDVKQPARKPNVSPIPEEGQLPASADNGIVRVTERRARLVPSRTYSSEQTPRVSESSSDTSISTDVAPSIPEADFADSLHADVQAAGSKGYAGNGEADDVAPLRNLQLPVSPNVAKSDTSESAVSRRKSVRMAPDVKLPPETPTSDAAETPRGNSAVNGAKEYPFGSASGGSGAGAAAELPRPMRIAPPPAAPARVSQKEEGPIDLAARERPSWNTRIGAADDSSSDEGNDGDGYASARKAFSSATRHLGAATGTLKSKAKSAASPSKGKKKKTTDGGYSMDVVGRSPASTRK
ncbi:hypothetical protein OC835_000942 [Tilletia horrida]|nr:hypothetical protein OC835_000942 [Tilletia horrida]